MRAVAGVLGALAGLLIVGIAAYLLLLKKPPVSSRPPVSVHPNSGSSAPSSRNPVNVPISREDQLREELGKKRLPFYRYLHDNFGNQIERFSVLEDFDTLDLVVKNADESTLAAIVQQAIAPSAKQYGFRRVRFYTRNAPNSVEPFTVVAESSDDGSGRWNTFMK